MIMTMEKEIQAVIPLIEKYEEQIKEEEKSLLKLKNGLLPTGGQREV